MSSMWILGMLAILNFIVFSIIDERNLAVIIGHIYVAAGIICSEINGKLK